MVVFCWLFLVLCQPSTPTKPVMFADWVAGVSPPDPQTINKHVHDMVEVRLHFTTAFIVIIIIIILILIIIICCVYVFMFSYERNQK